MANHMYHTWSSEGPPARQAEVFQQVLVGRGMSKVVSVFRCPLLLGVVCVGSACGRGLPLSSVVVRRESRSLILWRQLARRLNLLELAHIFSTT